jgi:hypothetical protein
MIPKFKFIMMFLACSRYESESGVNQVLKVKKKQEEEQHLLQIRDSSYRCRLTPGAVQNWTPLCQKTESDSQKNRAFTRELQL